MSRQLQASNCVFAGNIQDSVRGRDTGVRALTMMYPHLSTAELFIEKMSQKSPNLIMTLILD